MEDISIFTNLTNFVVQLNLIIQLAVMNNTLDDIRTILKEK